MDTDINDMINIILEVAKESVERDDDRRERLLKIASFLIDKL